MTFLTRALVGSAPALATLASMWSGPQIGYCPVRTHFLSKLLRVESGQYAHFCPKSWNPRTFIESRLASDSPVEMIPRTDAYAGSVMSAVLTLFTTPAALAESVPCHDAASR